MNKSLKILSQFVLFVSFSIVIWVSTLMAYSEAFDVETTTYLENALTFYVSLDVSALLCRKAFQDKNKKAVQKKFNEFKADVLVELAERLMKNSSYSVCTKDGQEIPGTKTFYITEETIGKVLREIMRGEQK